MCTAPTCRSGARAALRALALAAMASGTAWAAPAANRTQTAPVPIDITADQGQFDNTGGVATYTGHVTMVRAKLTLTGAHLVVKRRTPKTPITAVLTGQPAHMHQGLTQRISEVVHGTALTITYSQARATITLTGHAIVHRGQDLLTAHQVVYHLTNGVITAAGQKHAGGRVHMVLHPSSGGSSQ